MVLGKQILILLACVWSGLTAFGVTHSQPNIVLVMTDDQGWGQTGYYDHPVLETPHLDAMAANGLRFDRFYAGSPVCSPTRASVLTGRHSDRSGVPGHGHALRLQEKSLAEALRNAGYTTGHFGKWHLNGLRGPGVPLLGDDKHSPGAFGFDEWLTVSNYFDIDPLLSREGEFIAFEGDSSAVIVREALHFIADAKESKKPFLAVIWDGSPHSPFLASEADQQAFADLDEKSRQHYGELVAFDRSVGALRAGLRELGLAENTLIWYCSDNGGLNGILPETTGGLRGHKGTVWEGGLRVPGIIEWPAVIRARITEYPASTMDIFPTIAEICGLPESSFIKPVDGISLLPLFEGPQGPREEPIAFRFQSQAALIDNNFKLVKGKGSKKEKKNKQAKGDFALYDLSADPAESQDLSTEQPEYFQSLVKRYLEWEVSVKASVAGKDYPEGYVLPLDPYAEQHFWHQDDRYAPYLEQFQQRPEYKNWLKGKLRKN
ncbi:MAG: sulfatase-like hydrolase/transferase [Verrucomicrobiota bacterium]